MALIPVEGVRKRFRKTMVVLIYPGSGTLTIKSLKQQEIGGGLD